MSRTEDETLIIETINQYIKLHDSGTRIFHDQLRTSKTFDELKHILSKLVNVYFFETSILFRVASVSAPAIIGLMKTIDKLPSKEEFIEIKSEAQSQYSKVREGLEIIKAALDDRTEREKSGEDIYG
jgi:hypothetical protein